jgi:hypothetical protein
MLLVVIATLVASGGVGAGEERRLDSRHAGGRGAPDRQPGKFYGVALAPPVYFVNFLLLYMSNPNEAAKMPAYRTTLPRPLSDCLESKPQGCPYSAYALSFDDDTIGNKNCDWPAECQTDPKWEQLAPGNAKDPAQINEPLGMERANQLAQQLGIDKAMILTDQEYQCTIGVPPRDDDRQIIFACINNISNSKGNTNIPLSSYGLAITDDDNGSVPAGDVQSLCAPNAPCLVFNDLFMGPLERIATVCGWETKLDRMVAQTPFTQFAQDGGRCQAFGGSTSGGPCIVEPVCTHQSVSR